MGYGKSWCSSYGKAKQKSGSSWEWKETSSEPYEPAYKRTCSNCGGRGHDAKNCSSRSMCPICGIPGHSKEICRNATKRCEICGGKGHLKNVCTYYKDPETKASKESWWSDVDSSAPCMRCGAEKFHPKHACPSFGHQCELCGRKNHYENMCGENKAKAKMAKKEDWKAKDWKSPGAKTGWKTKSTMSWKGQKSSKETAEKGKVTKKAMPWKIAMRPKSKAAKVMKTVQKKKQQQECYCCGSWEHQKIHCPFAHRRCEKCGRKGHLKSKCQQQAEEVPEAEAQGDGEGPGADAPELPEEEEAMDEVHEEIAEEGADVGPSEQGDAVEVCSCCGAVDHDAELCPLIDMTCELCGMQGHLDSMCFSHEVPSTEKPGLPKGQERPKSPEMQPRAQEDPPEMQLEAQEDAPEAQTPGGQKVFQCYCCGEWGHLKPSCPQRDNVCSLCGIQGHLEKKCLKRQQVECYCCGEYGHQKVNCPFKNIPCGYCGKLGHLRSRCRDVPVPKDFKKAPWHR